MKKFLTIVAVVAALFMVTACSNPASGSGASGSGASGSSGTYTIGNAPAWLTGTWGDAGNIYELVVAAGKFEIMTVNYAESPYSSMVSEVSGSDTSFSYKIASANQTYKFEKSGADVKLTIVTTPAIGDPTTVGPVTLTKK